LILFSRFIYGVFGQGILTKQLSFFFEEFKFLYNEMFCLDRKIKKHFKCKHFFEVFQFVKLVEIQIPSK